MLELTDENFEKEIQKADKPVVVDFMASWCSPCFVLGPILEKLAEEYKDKFILAKVSLEAAPLTAQKYGIERIPMTVLFNGGKPISGFIGARPEAVVRELLDKMLKENENKNEKIEELIKEYEEYAQKNNFKLNPNREVVERLIKGMLENEKKFGQRYCVCRRISGDPEKDKKIICPCVYAPREIEEQGHCFCNLFLKKENDEK